MIERRGELLLALAAFVVAPGCGAGVDEGALALTSNAAACTDTSVSLQLRAFIPKTLCSTTDGPDDSQCTTGFLQPPNVEVVCRAMFHGDMRAFSSAWEASHRVRGIVTIPTMRGDSCPTTAPRSTDCDASHRCACYPTSMDPSTECLFPDCVTQSATATAQVSQDGTSCAGDVIDTHYQVHAGYPLVAIAPDIYDKIEVHSSGSGAPHWGLYGSAQQYTVDVWHTPFPFHELVVSYACRTKTETLYQYSAKDCGPSPFNLGEPHQYDVHQQLSFAVVYSPNGGVTLQPAGAQPPPVCGTLPSGQQLGVGDALWSCDGRFHLTMQGDGNLVLYQANGPLWASRTNGRGGVVARMQADGNLVVYDAAGAALWASGTNGHAGAYAAVQNDGNLVVYAPGGHALWASGTSTACGCYSGDGAYCGDKVIEHADAAHCVLPFDFASGWLYACNGGAWSLQQRCAGNDCVFNPNGADHCGSSCAGPVCGTSGTCCAAGDWCGSRGQCCSGCGAGCPC